MDDQSLGRQLRAVRIEAGRTGAEMGRVLGLSQPAVSRIENSKTFPTDEDIRVWVEVCEKNPSLVARLIRQREREKTDRWSDKSVAGPPAVAPSPVNPLAGVAIGSSMIGLAVSPSTLGRLLAYAGEHRLTVDEAIEKLLDG
jgi:transcriptional regulator with XRE-family HTH domain